MIFSTVSVSDVPIASMISLIPVARDWRPEPKLHIHSEIPPPHLGVGFGVGVGVGAEVGVGAGAGEGVSLIIFVRLGNMFWLQISHDDCEH